ncbi:entericidin B membrane lipoprotein [Tritonibacter multivorans]|uniref:Entericidin B membrane lipoprotein n=1 Tax=Tritonibacter multivorans TaxID=928856 RepID=A0A0P1G507_9RHOB|nr:entericidin A/B family lipoprotein [Tritonibacter multivorans]MDA7421791.1 entericidin A/B family lipoprotein [Tritonibacter multivorans]CUH76871.1 entericidin B membrane lipoprotein [Tritonibacter multivorans]SFD05598.1 entericidin B [Tritonibacter multivorans]
MIRTALLLTCVLTLAACETAKGAGRDIEKAGQAIGNAASNVQKAL